MLHTFFVDFSQAYNMGLEEFEAGLFDSLQNIVEMSVLLDCLILVDLLTWSFLATEISVLTMWTSFQHCHLSTFPDYRGCKYLSIHSYYCSVMPSGAVCSLLQHNALMCSGLGLALAQWSFVLNYHHSPSVCLHAPSPCRSLGDNALIDIEALAVANLSALTYL